MDVGHELKHVVRCVYEIFKQHKLTRLGYKHVRPDNIKDEPFIWEA